MKNPFASKNLPQSVRRRIELAVAVAQERLLQTHVEHALALIEIAGDQVPFDAALDIYNRLLRIGDDEARVITTRALAKLGEEAGRTDSWPDAFAEEEPQTADEEPRSFLDHFRSRLRGRVNEELRSWIELAAARTEVAILDVHVGNALNFAEILQHEMPLTEAVELYLDVLDLRDSIAEVTYYFALARLAEERLPRKRKVSAIARPGDLRLVDEGGA